MASNAPKTLRCAIYTRKSTEHGLELEFNSLDAQREACEAYIKSQASLGWKALPQPYDDPAFSGGNLERPALKRLLADIEAGKVDVVVVYKIDRLTRSLADFAKLVEAFDARSISFVAVTQQFNTTTSMGRLTLNVLLSFAQFERELSSERVRDKIAASRAKGKWTGGNIPFGYRIENKKLVIDEQEAETVNISSSATWNSAVFELDWCSTSTPRHSVHEPRNPRRVRRARGTSPFFYGSPRLPIEQPALYWRGASQRQMASGRTSADHRQELRLMPFRAKLAANSVTRKNRRSESGALLMGKLFDDKR
jgi:site-specific DNA recombinase